MTRKDTGWRPNGKANQYKGNDVWDHTVGPGEINDGDRERSVDEEADVDDESASEDGAETDEQ